MAATLDQLVWQRAKSRCEYCHLPQAFSPLPHAIDHIIARKHGGPTVEGNLALACFFCNSYKGPNIAGLDPESGRIVRLFHPRKDRWKRHFAWDGPLLIGQTRIEGATIAVLVINDPEFLAFREHLIREGTFPS
jgi:hypothetical protein